MAGKGAEATVTATAARRAIAPAKRDGRMAEEDDGLRRGAREVRPVSGQCLAQPRTFRAPASRSTTDDARDARPYVRLRRSVHVQTDRDSSRRRVPMDDRSRGDHERPVLY